MIKVRFVDGSPLDAERKLWEPVIDQELRSGSKVQDNLVLWLAFRARLQDELNGGFETRWTEKLGLNEADMVFIIEADPLTAAGLEIAKLEQNGWVFKTAGTDGANPNQLIKTYRLK